MPWQLARRNGKHCSRLNSIVQPKVGVVSKVDTLWGQRIVMIDYTGENFKCQNWHLIPWVGDDLKWHGWQFDSLTICTMMMMFDKSSNMKRMVHRSTNCCQNWEITSPSCKLASNQAQQLSPFLFSTFCSELTWPELRKSKQTKPSWSYMDETCGDNYSSRTCSVFWTCPHKWNILFVSNMDKTGWDIYM